MSEVPEKYPLSILKISVWAGLLILFVLASLSIAFAKENASATAWVAASTLNLRTAPSVDTEVVDQLEYGVLVDVMEHSQSWSRIRAEKSEGWVHTSYLKNTYYAWVNPEDVALHENKSLSSQVIYSLDRNDRLFITREDDQWAYAEFQGSAGWIYTSFLRRGPETGWVNTDFLNVRSEPLYSSQRLTRLMTGDEVFILQELRSWTEVRTGDTEGWVPSSEISRYPVKASASSTQNYSAPSSLESQNHLPATVRQAIESGQILIGMETDQVRAALGPPDIKMRTSDDGEQWRYFSDTWFTYINFHLDYLTSWGREPAHNNFSDSGTGDIQ